MYTPEFVVRVEFAQTDIDNLREWRVVLGGSQRGGLTADHDYSPIWGRGLHDNIEQVIATTRELLEAYACTLSATQLEFDLSQPPPS